MFQLRIIRNIKYEMHNYLLLKQMVQIITTGL
jgi:hypothetical protein